MKDVTEVFIEDELTSSYLSYAMSVIVGRALPDVRDGLKPVHRRILFVMKELNNSFNSNYKKSARIVGDVIGKYHPHGEVAVYDSIVRLAQPFVQRYVLIDGQGNFGSIDGDSPAAMRYTEIRMSEFSDFLLKDLDCSVVDFVDNYDNTEKQPVVLPSMIPNLLINGSCGIAVGMATNIPPHNLTEIVDACLLLIDNNDITIEELMKVVLAPDFPTYGILYGTDELLSIYKTGKGKFFLRANAYVSLDCIIIDELPYQVNKSKLIESIVELVNAGVIDGIKLVRDESDKDGLRICIEVYKDKDPTVILNNLYISTKMQISYNVNIVALVDNVPKLLNLKSILSCFLDHRKEVVYRRTKYKLSKSEHRLHVLEGLCIVVLNIDKLINLLVLSSDISDIRKFFLETKWNLYGLSEFLDNSYSKRFIDNYIFSDIQISFILDIKLSRLTRLEKNKIFDEYKSIFDDISNYNNIISDKSVLDCIIKDELFFIKEKFGDKRRTKIILSKNESKKIDFISKEVVVITFSNSGFIKSQLLKNYIVQKRGGKGKNSLYINSNDVINKFLVCDTHNIILCFSSVGKVYWIDPNSLPIFNRKSRGSLVNDFLSLSENEKIIFMLPVKSYDEANYLLLITKKGFIKRFFLKNIKNKRSNGLIVIDLSKDDIIADVAIVKNSDVIILFSKFGRSVKFFVKNIRCSSRLSRGVIGIKLNSNDSVVSLVVVVNDNSYIITATDNGYGKCTNVIDFPFSTRGSKGVISMKLDKKNGLLIGAKNVFLNNDLLLITCSGIISRIKISDIPCVSRNTKGVFLINLSNNEKLIGIEPLYEEFL